MSMSSDQLQVAMVRLRLEGVPCRIYTRQEFEDARSATTTSWEPWPLSEQVCVLFCREISATKGHAFLGTSGVIGVQAGYVLTDGIERHDVTGTLYEAALALRGVTPWVASGTN